MLRRLPALVALSCSLSVFLFPARTLAQGAPQPPPTPVTPPTPPTPPTPATPPAATHPAQPELEKAFAERMTNTAMIGQYTLGKQGAPKSDKYTIVSVRKLEADNWLFTARVQFGEKDVTIPMIIPIKWAGDTPVISVTNLWFPGLGTYSARVLIYENEYAGTWKSGGANPHGGQMWGRIEKLPATQPAGNKAEGGRQKTEPSQPAPAPVKP